MIPFFYFKEMEEDVLTELNNMISSKKVELFEEIAALRTNYLTVVLEDVYQEHNASAILRTCDCFGIQELRTIEKNNEYKIQRDIARGAGRWVDLYSYGNGINPTLECLNELKSKGYKIVATTPHEKDTKLSELPLDCPMALVFGTEMNGISSEVVDNADYFVKIPMYGFTESYNISVAVALTLQSLRNRLQNENISFVLSKEEQIKLKIKWATKIIRNGDIIEQEIHRRLMEKTK